MKRPSDVVPASGGTGGLPSRETYLAKFPSIVEHLCSTQYDDGGVRVPSAISITVNDGLINLALNDKDASRSLYTADDTLLGALKLMEEAISTGKGQWRPWKVGKKK